MEFYETGPLDKEQFGEFVTFFDEHIGTDYEVNEDPDLEGKVYIVCFELEPEDVRMLEDFKNNL